MEVGAPFLERTRDKLLERARAIVERCPKLERYFDDPTLRVAQPSLSLLHREFDDSPATVKM